MIDTDTSTQRSSGTPAARQAAFAAGVILSALCNFVFHAVAARQLAPERYSELAALLALAVALAVPVSALQTALSASVARTLASGAGVDLRPLQRRVAAAAAGGCLAVAALAPLLSSHLHLPTRPAIVLVGVWLALTALELVTEGALLGAGKTPTVGMCLAARGAVRVAAALLLLPSFGLVGAMTATVIAEAAMAALFALSVRRAALHRAATAPVVASVSFTDGMLTLTSQLAHWLLVGSAVMLGNRYLPSAQVGAFAAAATLAGAGAFLPQAVALAAFPGFAAARQPGKALRNALAVTAGLGVALVLGLTVFTGTAFAILFGDEYEPSRALVCLLAVSSALLGCTGILSHFLIARRHTAALLGWPWLTVAWLAVATGPADATAVAWRLAIAVAGATATMLVAVVRETARLGEARPLPATGVDLPLYAAPSRQLSVVMPSYNTGAQLRPAVEGVLATLVAAAIDAEVIVVIDGSTDGSDRELEGLEPAIRVQVQPRNQGKGEALRTGFGLSHGGVVGFIDSDGDIDPAVLVALYRQLTEEGSAWAAIATKWHPDAVVRASRVRALLSSGFRLLSAALFRLSVSDTQCGCKVFRREPLGVVLAQSRQTGFALDLELLAIGARHRFGTVLEHPVHLARVGVHTISARAVLRTFGDALEVWRTARRVSPAAGYRTPSRPQPAKHRVAVTRTSRVRAPGRTPLTPVFQARSEPAEERPGPSPELVTEP